MRQNGWWFEITLGLIALAAIVGAMLVYRSLSVRAGEVIGRVGGTGQSRGEHLHLELRKPDGESANPLLYFSGNP